MTAAVIFTKTYDGESIVDMGRDVHEAFDPRFNEAAKQITQDEHGFQTGQFVVSITWIKPD